MHRLHDFLVRDVFIRNLGGVRIDGGGGSAGFNCGSGGGGGGGGGRSVGGGGVRRRSGRHADALPSFHVIESSLSRCCWYCRNWIR